MITYRINGTDFRDYGVYVSKSDGLFDRPKIKEISSIDWDTIPGEDIDLSRAYVSAREITLSCFVKATSKEQFIGRMCGFMNLFDTRRIGQLDIDVNGTKLQFSVYCRDAVTVEKTWNDRMMIGTFKLKLTEPEQGNNFTLTATHSDNTTFKIGDKDKGIVITRAVQTCALLADDVVDVTVESPIAQDYRIGDMISVFGRDYRLNRLPNVKKNGERIYVYDCQFEGIQYDLLRVTYDVNINTTNNKLQDIQGDSLTGDLKRFMDVLISNANRVFPDKWALGTCPETDSDKTLTFAESDNCLSVLQNLCSSDNFGVEFDIEKVNGVYTINLEKKIGSTLPFTLEYGKGKGLYSINRDNVSSSNIITRLKVFGSTENITSKYRADRLCMLGKNKSSSYIEKAEAVARYGIFEGRKNFDNIKPTFTGKVTEIVDGDVLSFIDVTFPFDIKKKKDNGETEYMIAGVSPKVHFNSGNLAGYEFEVHDYDHETHKFTLVKQTDERGNVFPSDTSPAFQFEKNNTYKVIDIAYSDDIVHAAETRLADEGEKYYDEVCQPRVKYSIEVTKSFVAKHFGTSDGIVNVFAPGDCLPIKDDEIGVDKAIRVKSFTRNLMIPYDYSLIISDTQTSADITTRVIGELGTIDKILTLNNLKDPAQARANWRSSREVLNMVFDPETGGYYGDKITPASVDTIALSVGAKSMQFGLTNTVFQPNFNGNAQVVKWKGGVLTHYTIDPENARSWALADGEITFTDTDPYYIYARCNRNGEDGVFEFSKTQHKCEESATVYYFLVGVLNSVDAETKVRSIALTYGFTMINGRFIKTGRIESADGTTYFDLDNSEIGGRIVFTSNGEEKTLEELGAEALESKDFINNTLPGLLSGLETQIDGKIETWFTADDPSTAWTTSNERKKHVGDLWYNTSTNEANRYSASLAWEVIKDADALKALQDASKAQDTADGKRRVFVDTPTTPYDRGDLWANGTFLKRSMKTRLTGAMVESDWENATNYTGDESLNEFIQNTYNSAIADIYGQLDGVVETHFGNGVPTLENAPASAWTTEKEMEEHLGDMYYDNDSGIAYRFSKENGNYMWVELRDKGIVEALAAASKAQDTADGKRRVFVDTPYPPYDVGDLWAQGSTGGLMRCIVARQSGAFNASDWDKATNYTGDENLNAFINGLFGDTISDIYNQLDGVVESWYSTSDPANNWTSNEEKAKHVGDQWFDTENNRLYYYIKHEGVYQWKEIHDQDAIDAAIAASKAQDTADGKRRVFVDTPYPPYDVGDLWAQGSTGGLMRCIVARQSGAFNASDWDKATGYTDDSALNDFIYNTYNPCISNLNKQIDGKIDTWFQSSDPSMSWSLDEREAHVGDMWYNTTKKRLQRYCKMTSSTLVTYIWRIIEDSQAIDAYKAASNAQDTADGKRRVFVDTPYPPYDVGDLWVDGKDLRRCITVRTESESYIANDWVVCVYYDNTKTIIDGGLVTSGTIQVAGDNASILAGITGQGTADDAIRFWAGASFENRATAPFRVQQGGSMYATKAYVEGELHSIIGSIGKWLLTDGVLKSEKTVSKTDGTPIIQLDSKGGVIQIKDEIFMDARGMRMISGGYDRLRIANCSVGEYSKYWVEKDFSGEHYETHKHASIYIPAGNTWFHNIVKFGTHIVNLGYFGVGSTIDFKSISLSFNVPNNNLNPNAVVKMYANTPAFMVYIKCNGNVVKQFGIVNGTTYTNGDYANYAYTVPDSIKTIIVDESLEGNYSVELEQRDFAIYASLSGSLKDFDYAIRMNFGFVRGSYERTILGNDGMLSCWKNGAMLMTNDQFFVALGDYQFRITPNNGIQKSSDGGTKWTNL